MPWWNVGIAGRRHGVDLGVAERGPRLDIAIIVAAGQSVAWSGTVFGVESRRAGLGVP